MTRRISTILVLSLLAFAFVAMSAYAVKSPDESRRVINERIYKSLQYAFPYPDATNSGSLNANPAPVLDGGAPLGNATDSRFDDWKGVQIGDTYYEYQHNGRMTRMVDWGNDVAGGDGLMIHFEWMRIGPTIIFPLTGRHYSYNVYYAGGPMAGTFLGQTAVQAGSDYAGYVTMDVTEDGRAVLSGHNNQGAGYQAHTYWDFGPGFAFFSKNRRVPDSTLAEATGQNVGDSLKSAIWPSMCYQEHPTDPNLNVTHVFTQVSEDGAGDPQAIIYFRKVGNDDMGEWDFPPYVPDTVHDIAQDVVSGSDGKAALVWAANLPSPTSGGASSHNYWPFSQWDNDIWYQISDDYGASWGPKINVTQNVDGVDGYRPYTDLQALITTDNDLHIVWGSRVWPADANTGGDAGMLRGRVHHWGENLAAGNIRTAANLEWDQEFCNGGAWQLNGAKMNIGECDNKLYVIWTQFNDPEVMMNDCHNRALDGTDFIGAANGELYLAVSDDMGLTWDGARNLTNTHTPACDSATGINGECRSEHWSSMNRLGTNLTGNMSGAEVLDPSGEFAGDYFLDVQYMADVDPGGIIQEEGTWQQAGVRWFRLACVEPVPTAIFSPSWTEIAFPEYTKHGTAYVKPLTIENGGNIDTEYDMTLAEEASAHPGWLTADASITTNVTIPSGANNSVTGNVYINANLAYDAGGAGTIVHLKGSMTAIGNHVNSPYVFPINFWVADTVIEPTFDTITTGCFSLIVSNTGNWGKQGEGNVNLDFFEFGDCDNAEPGTEGDTLPGYADVYVYDASPVICWTDATDTVRCNYSIFGQGYLSDVGFFPEAHSTDGAYYTYDTCGGADDSTFICNTYYSRFITRDTGIQIEKWWYTPDGSANQGSNFIIQVLKISRHPLATGDEIFTGLNIGEAIDWDIPSDSASRNRSGFDAANKLVYLQGSEYDDDPQECQENSDRYGGIELLAMREVVGGVVTETYEPYGAWSGSNALWVYNNEDGFVQSELDSLMTAREGYVLSDSIDADLNTIMTFKSGYDLTEDKTLWIFKCLITSRLGYAAFIATAADCHTFYDDYLKEQYAVCGACCEDAEPLNICTVTTEAACDALGGTYKGDGVSCDPDPCQGCCDGTTGNVNMLGGIDISDLVYLVDYMFTGGPPPPCIEEANINGLGGIDISDLVYLVDYMFTGGPPPPDCP